MTSTRTMLLVSLAVLLAAGPARVFAAEAGKAKAARRANPALEQIEDVPGLPRVLLIGDSISMGYTPPVRELLKGKANVRHPPVNCGPTTLGVAQLDAWLGEKKWDVIHFNFGLHDLKYINDKGALVAVADGHQQVPIDQYRKNLEEIVTRLKKTGAALIWASTTPVPEGAAGRVKGDAARYNAVAAEVMKKHGVTVNDLYGFALERLDKIQQPKNVHFTPEGSKALAELVTKHVLKALETR
ncbi:MAG: SGNH/GDSL hydrolase family protein [Planctomycetes bacterium]|nr:SGNH/GDSL hydrolase family protein [Planctomycetota bacterium]